jgi:hypothetical protein
MVPVPELSDLPEESFLSVFVVHTGAYKSLAFPVSPMGGLQHNQKIFSWIG